jgi:curli biogenesis system outer membrane secretion channel CsgG
MTNHLTSKEMQMKHEARKFAGPLHAARRSGRRRRDVSLAGALAVALLASSLALASGPAAFDAVPAPPMGGAAAAPSGAMGAAVPRSGERVAVTIYEFRSSLPNVSGKSATDMFTTVLMQSGRFIVVERNRLNDGVVREKQLQQQGLADGGSETVKLRGARYIFEGAVTEANESEDQRSGGISVAGMQISSGSNRDSLAIDVRIVDANNGDVVDAVTIKQSIRSEASSFSGIGSLLSTVAAQRGRSTAFIPDVNFDRQRREGVDAVLREAIARAVGELIRRFPA